ncbi:MAG TPA: leucine--tRNA ligase, partial [Candidatus Altiarchaeales archaeon]|nr:leucine--tRNA ligase [Candidatus Altiarchaeales archaeon]
MQGKFDHKALEEKWIKRWEEAELFKAKVMVDKPKFYLTVAYPYPSGSMHVGHGRTYTVPDVIARYKRMRGYNVLFPMAWHVTGSPVIGIAERIKKGDEKTLYIYGKLYRVPEETLKTFTKAENIVKYFSEEYKRNMTQLGFSIDWSREFLTITPQYSKFIEWQYKTLYERGLVVKGKHAVRYCPRCDNPVGDHDLLEGENASILEFTIIKFKILGDECILPAATLRPETIFGVTNMWVNPRVRYVKAKVDKELWIISKECAEKLKYLHKDVEIVSEILGEELLGKSCINPLTNEELPILPASFVDPDYSTGIVMSVPAHAPYDFVALEDLKKQNVKEAKNIAPKVIIKSKKYDINEIPAEKIVKELKIESQADKNLEKA